MPTYLSTANGLLPPVSGHELAPTVPEPLCIAVRYQGVIPCQGACHEPETRNELDSFACVVEDRFLAPQSRGSRPAVGRWTLAEVIEQIRVRGSAAFATLDVFYG